MVQKKDRKSTRTRKREFEDLSTKLGKALRKKHMKQIFNESG